MHRITGLELLRTLMLLELRTLMLCLVQLSKWRECKATDAEKLLSQWEKGAKCNFKSTAQVYERCFFFMKWNVICNAEDRFSCVRAFCRASHVRASMHRITSLELLKTNNDVFSATKQMKRMQGKDAEKLLSQWEKLLNAILSVTLKYMKDVSFSWNEMLLQCRRQIFMFRAFLRAKNTNAVRAKNTNAVFSATKQMKRMQGQGCWKASFSVRERC